MTKTDKVQILVVDDDSSITDIIGEHLADIGYLIHTAGNATEAREIFGELRFEAVILDINLPSASGLDLLEEFKDIRQETIVIMISAINDIDTVVTAMQMGAYDYLVKPIVDLNQVNLRIERALEERQLKSENEALRKELSRKIDIPEMQSRSPAMEQVKEMIKTVANYDSTVLITGDSGTGKEVAARNIHKYSSRNEQPFIAVNCGGIPSSLLESTLFGYEKGAFTGAEKQTRGLFEESNNGTIFLDEVTETNPDFQIKLLRVLEDSKIRRVGGTEEIHLDLRVIAATNKDMRELVEEGKFRQDLFYRLNVVNINLPPLRDRKEDIPLIVDYQLKQLSHRLGREDIKVAPEVVSKFQNHHWPGNIRELINVLESAIIMSSDRTITYDNLPSHFKNDFSPAIQYKPSDWDYQEAKADFERSYFRSLLEHVDDNITEAANIAGITRQHLYHKLKQLEIERS